MNPGKRFDDPVSDCMLPTDRTGDGTNLDRRAPCGQARVLGTAAAMKRGGFDEETANSGSRPWGRRPRRGGDDR